MTVSYCIPLYNKERYIAAVLEAALAERAATGGEILVYDDCSTDASAEIAARAPVTLIRGPANCGVFEATNRLVAQASQPYLRLVDADDRVIAGSTAHLRSLLDQHGALLAQGVCGSEDAEPAPQDFAAAETRVEQAPVRPLLRNIDFNLSASLMPTAAARDVLPLNGALRIGQDFCVALRLAQRGPLARSAAIVTLQPVETGNRLSRKLAAMYRDLCLIVAEELTGGIGAQDAAFAVRRQAARCSRYFRREAPAALGLADRAFLLRCRLGSALEPMALHAARLRRIAGLFGRDAARVLS
jgi:glycosyltransferase involved in cell wall biosynthesis